MKIMKLLVKSAIFFGFIALTTQDITKPKGCDCSICNGVDNRLNPLVGKKIDDYDKPGCSICEQKKEMLRMERERQQKLQKCPFEILGSPAIKGKTSEEIFDEFRELIVPSQNGFFDMMRGVVRTMHVSSEAELKWAKEKEARELAQKRAEEAKKRAEEIKKQRLIKEAKKEKTPDDPKVTVVLKQKPCGQFIPPQEQVDGVKMPFYRRLPKEIMGNRFEERYPDEREAVPNLQMIDFMPDDDASKDYLDLDLGRSPGNEDLIQQLFSEEVWTTEPTQETVESQETDDEFIDETTTEAFTESPFVKFMTNEEFRAQVKGNLNDDINMGFNLLPTHKDWELQKAGSTTP